MAATMNCITADNRGPLVNVVAWVFMVTMIIVSLTKVGSTLYYHRALRLDDVLLAIAATVAIAEQVAHGLGTARPLEDGSEASSYEQASYASQILYVLALYFTKTTTALLIGSFAVKKWVYLAMSCLIYGHLAWTVTSLLVIAFQCSLPHPWAFGGNGCINMVAFWSVYAAIDMMTDVLLIVVPFAIVRKLQTMQSRRISIISAFTIRFLLIPLTILRIIFIGQTYATDRSSGVDEANATIATEVHMHMAVILACVPFVKHVIDGLQGGIMTSDLLYGPIGVRSHSKRGQVPSRSLFRFFRKDTKSLARLEMASVSQRQESNDSRTPSQPHKRSEPTLMPTDEPSSNNNASGGNNVTVHAANISSSECI